MFELNWIALGPIIFLVMVVINIMQIRASMMSQKARLDKAWREVENALLNRRNRIPAIIQALENHASSQNQAIDWVRNFAAAVRQAASRAEVALNDPKERAKREDELSKRMRALVDLAGTYPDVIGNPYYREALTRLLTATDEIAEAERYYNDNARDFNERLEGFPNKQLASMFKLKPAPSFRLKATRGDGGDEANAEMHSFFSRR
ncbi:MAG: LemA family protein [Pseudomonadota bacterium]